MTRQTIPAAALAQHIAILGKTGSGKTYAAKGVVEGILEEGGRVCIIDPTGAWHGLRSSSSGKSAGFPVVIFGGSHADLPLAAAHGEAIADIIGTSSTPAIVDTSAMKVSERTQFFADFADAIVRKNRGPLHLIVDEAHLFAPQGRVSDPRSGMMLHAANNLVSLGRSRGLRIILITQRPAKLHKDSLTQVETLVALRLIAPQDRNAVEEWIHDNADAKKGREIIGSLATLKTGEGWIWAPEIGVLERVSFPRIKTFDSSRAPDGEAGAGPVLAAIDRDAIAAKLKAVGADALANDPKALKKRIVELETQVRRTADRVGTVIRDEDAERQAEARGYQKGVAAARDALRKVLSPARLELNAAIKDAADGLVGDVAGTLEGLSQAVALVAPAPESRASPPPAPIRAAEPRRAPPPAPRTNGSGASHDLSGAARKILAALAQHPEGCTAGKLALLTGYTYSGGFRNALSELRSCGYLEGANTGVMRITETGHAAGPFDPLPTGEALRQHWLSFPHFSAAARKVLAVLLAQPGGLDAEELARMAGYEYSGGFRNALSELRTAGVLVGRNTELMRPSEDLL